MNKSVFVNNSEGMKERDENKKIEVGI